jgi:hypothetical protein
LECRLKKLTDALLEAFEREIEEYEEGDEIQETEIPLELQIIMNRAYDLAELHEIGAVFHYPDALTCEEWIAMRALQQARRKAERRVKDREREESDLKERERRLMYLTGRTHGDRN